MKSYWLLWLQLPWLPLTSSSSMVVEESVDSLTWEPEPDVRLADAAPSFLLAMLRAEKTNF